MYRDGLGVEADGNVALFWLRRAADRGHPEATGAVATLYAGWPGIPTYCIVSLQSSVRAAELGSARAMYHIGLPYAEGRGVAKDERSLEMVQPGLQSSYRLRRK
jgi:TPR repeat protein